MFRLIDRIARAPRPVAAERPAAPPPCICAATPADVTRLSEVLAAAFAHDPVWSWLIPDARRRPRALQRFFALELRTVGLVRGTVWTSDDRRGAALCLDPGRWRLPWPVAVAHAPAFAAAFRGRLAHAMALQLRMERRHMREAHYYFPYLGVEPAAQGQGLGRRLMAPALERCDRERLPAYLEASSPRNAALYERLGFAAVEEMRLGSSPPLILMVRTPDA